MSTASRGAGRQHRGTGAHLRARCAALDLAGVRLAAASSLYRTAPVGLTDQPDFINAVACLETDLRLP